MNDWTVICVVPMCVSACITFCASAATWFSSWTLFLKVAIVKLTELYTLPFLEALTLCQGHSSIKRLRSFSLFAVGVLLLFWLVTCFDLLLRFFYYVLLILHSSDLTQKNIWKGWGGGELRVPVLECNKVSVPVQLFILAVFIRLNCTVPFYYCS